MFRGQFYFCAADPMVQDCEYIAHWGQGRTYQVTSAAVVITALCVIVCHLPPFIPLISHDLIELINLLIIITSKYEIFNRLGVLTCRVNLVEIYFGHFL